MYQTLKFAVVFTLSFLIISCSKDDDSLSGTYELSTTTATCGNNSETLNFDEDGCDTSGGIEYCESGILNFSSDGTFTSTIRLTAPALGDLFSINGSGTYVANGNIVTLCFPGDCTDFRMNGNNLVASVPTNGCTLTLSYQRI